MATFSATVATKALALVQDKASVVMGHASAAAFQASSLMDQSVATHHSALAFPVSNSRWGTVA